MGSRRKEGERMPEEALELPQEKIYREALRDIRNRIQQVDDDILKLAEKEECQEKAKSRS
jgi:hypothetical protein